jgi:hypothetical protein
MPASSAHLKSLGNGYHPIDLFEELVLRTKAIELHKERTPTQTTIQVYDSIPNLIIRKNTLH